MSSRQVPEPGVCYAAFPNRAYAEARAGEAVASLARFLGTTETPGGRAAVRRRRRGRDPVTADGSGGGDAHPAAPPPQPVTAGTAADAETIGLEQFIHCWCDLGEALTWRRFFAERVHDERDAAVARRAAGDRSSSVWDETARLTAWCAMIDADLIPRRARERAG